MKFLTALALMMGLTGTALIVSASLGSNINDLEVSSKEMPAPPLVLPLLNSLESTPKAETVKTSILVLKKRNTLVLHDVVTTDSVSEISKAAIDMSHRLNSDDDIILVLNTPGGNIDAGERLIDVLSALPQKVKTLNLFAASMGFQIAQNLGERMITPHGLMMSHLASGSIDGNFDGNFDTRFKMIKRNLLSLDQIAANRMKMSLKDYRNLIHDEYWVYGFDAAKDHAADQVVLAKCDSSLSGVSEKTVQTMFGEVNVQESDCPLITSPLKIEAASEAAKKFFTMFYNDPRNFVETFIITNKYKAFLPN